MKTKKPPPDKKAASKKNFDIELDLFERRLEELRILYEQHFVDLLPFRPEKEHKEIVRLKRRILKAPFKNSAKKFRMRQLITRYNTLDTYWARIIKAREEGKYVKDVFKAEMREKMQKTAAFEASEGGAADRGFKQLFGSYEDAMKKAGMKSENLDYGAFKKSLMKQAKVMKEKHGVKKLNYKIVVKDGRAVVKAVAGKTGPAKKKTANPVKKKTKSTASKKVTSKKTISTKKKK